MTAFQCFASQFFTWTLRFQTSNRAKETPPSYQADGFVLGILYANLIPKNINLKYFCWNNVFWELLLWRQVFLPTVKESTPCERSGYDAGRHEQAHGQGHTDEAKAGRKGGRMEYHTRNAAGVVSLSQYQRFRIFRIPKSLVWKEPYVR